MMLKRAKAKKTEMDMTPMIDCVFLLLIFFLVATQIKESQARVRLALPESTEALLDLVKKEKLPITINIVPKEPGEEGIGLKPYWVLGVPHSLEELRPLLRLKAQQMFEVNQEAASVRIRADRASTLRQLQMALKACQNAKILHVLIAAEKVRQVRGYR